MAATQMTRPAVPEFGPRRPSFDLAEALEGDWYGGSAFKTAFFNALSMLFPAGEKFFIDTVRHYREEIDDPKLLAEIAAFTAQEGTHRVQHQRYNELLCDRRGYDLERIERPTRRRIKWARRLLPARQQLAATVVTEHLTAMLADTFLGSPDTLEGADPEVAALWRWHLVEEAEHKAVAFDTFVAVGGTLFERRFALLGNTFLFLNDVFRNMVIMLRHDRKLWDRREWLEGYRYLFGEPGLIRRNAGAFWRFRARDFHPRELDNRELIAEWKQLNPSLN